MSGDQPELRHHDALDDGYTRMHEVRAIAPADLRLRPKDLLIVYGREGRLQEISTRVENNRAAHHKAKVEHERDLDKQREQIEQSEEA